MCRIPLSGSGTVFALEDLSTKEPVGVLVVDDDEIFCPLLAEILEELGMEAVWTTDSLVGYEGSTQCSCDVFIVPIIGNPSCRRSEDGKAGADIILISAFSDEDLLVTSFAGRGKNHLCAIAWLAGSSDLQAK